MVYELYIATEVKSYSRALITEGGAAALAKELMLREYDGCLAEQIINNGYDNAVVDKYREYDGCLAEQIINGGYDNAVVDKYIEIYDIGGSAVIVSEHDFGIITKTKSEQKKVIGDLEKRLRYFKFDHLVLKILNH